MEKAICKQCGCEIKAGCYNTPNGTYCVDCWEQKPRQEREEIFKTSLRRLAALGGLGGLIGK